jgi:signal transduction histidine kinase/FixJ family two-component response regulator
VTQIDGAIDEIARHTAQVGETLSELQARATQLRDLRRQLVDAAALPEDEPATSAEQRQSGRTRTDILQSVFPGDSHMARLMRAFDWSASEVGVPEQWPESLRAAVRICVGSRNPIVIWWGKRALTQIYNDGYMRILTAAKHPQWLGRSGAECWSEIMETMGPMWDQVLATGEATWAEDFLYIMNRNLPREECYFTFSYSALRNDSGSVDGILCICYETSSRVIGDGRLRTLRDLGRTVAAAKTPELACQSAAEIFGANPGDIPFSLLYLVEDGGKRARLVAASGFAAEADAGPASVDLTSSDTSAWPLTRVLASGSTELVTDLSSRFGRLPGGLWPEPPETALVVPLTSAGQTRGFLVAGFSTRRMIDADYRSFFDLLGGHVSTAIANAQAFEDEKKRAETLAELDRAKTAFFTNVSHEFRTPLTLLLGPLGEPLAETTDEGQRARLELLHRNAVRLQKLVNTLLDFSRIEAGRMQASYDPTDLAPFTRELASMFRSAVEQAGLRFVVDCAPLTEPVYVDRDMYEKIVLNLLSNAFKFTLEGEIAVTLRDAGASVELSVADTGAGIAVDQLPHVFERFHRIEGTPARTHEGTGIGLALVQELVKLHGGSVVVTSVAGEGTTFTVSIPKGHGHLSTERIGAARTLATTALAPDHYVEEAMRWLPGRATRAADDSVPIANAKTEPSGGSRPYIVWADDNTDMREYVSRLLDPLYDVEAVADGEAALGAVRRRLPDLILADVMMPRLDGFGLLKALRADERARSIPVILLSARAGEESRVEGMTAGADDYLVKPFSARELRARVDAHLKMARLRTESERAVRQSEARLAVELADTQQLQRISSGLIDEGNCDALYSQIVDAARAVMHASSGSLQMLGADRDELLLLAYSGFVPESAAYWSRVRMGDASSCAQATVRQERVIVADVEACEPLVGTEDLVHFRLCGIRATQSTPLVSRTGRLVGMMSTHWREVHQPSERELGTLDLLARQAADLIERRTAEQALRESEARLQALNEDLEGRVRDRTSQISALFTRLVSAQEEERRRIARDIHDQLGQQMTALRMNLESLQLKSREHPRIAEQTERTQRLAEEVDQAVDFLTWDLRPPALDVGLVAAIRTLVTGWSQRFGIAADVDAPDGDDLPLRRDAEANLYRLVQEALHNIVKHAGATHVAVVLERRDGELVLVIEDDGCGFVPSRLQEEPEGGGLGLISMRERATLAGGHFEMESVPGAGTSVFVRIPFVDVPAR